MTKTWMQLILLIISCSSCYGNRRRIQHFHGSGTSSSREN